LAIAIAAAVLAAVPASSTEDAGSPDPAPVAVATDVETGAALFASVGCAGCHGANGQGFGIAPALRGNSFVRSPGNIVAQILEGDGAMPPFGSALSDAEIAAIVNFVRTEMNGNVDLIDADFVAIIRSG
jgi:cytochrome c oxidase subunit 2